MHIIVERRTVNLERLQETDQRARSEFFPQLQQAPGFIGFYLVADETNGTNVAIHVWESKARADAFDDVYRRWQQALDQYGHAVESDNRGETVFTIEPER